VSVVRTAIMSGSEPPIFVQRTRAGESSAYWTQRVNRTFGATNFPVAVPRALPDFSVPPTMAQVTPAKSMNRTTPLSIDQAVVQLAEGPGGPGRVAGDEWAAWLGPIPA
jgi:hypothetical protein